MTKQVNIDIEKLIKELQKFKDNGIKTLQLKGTLMIEEKGNLILYTNEKQM